VGESVGDDEDETDEEREPEQTLAQLLSKYEATTVGGLVSEMAGHIPLPGEVVEDGPLRLEVVASTDRLVERVRVGLVRSAAGEPG
jgi:CBS domain containing-hemolysin-like protein